MLADDPTKTVTIKHVPVSLWQRVVVMAVRRQCLIAEVVREALTEYLDREEAVTHHE